jgi:glycosyltransferase involved in cell wall biosynthesis
VRESVDILHVVPAYFPARGGVEVLIENLCSSLHERHGFTSAVLNAIATRGFPDVFEHRGTRVYSIDYGTYDHVLDNVPTLENASIHLAAIASVNSQVRSVIDLCKPQIVHLHFTTSLTSAVRSSTRALGIPVIFHVHGMITEHNQSSYKRDLRNAEWVCCVSDAVAHSIRSECHRVDPISVVRNGVVDPMVDMKPHRPVSPSVAMIGRLSEEKGFDDGLRALRAVRDTYPTLRIRIVGRGPMEATLFEMAREFDLLDSIDYYGQLPHEEALRVAAGVDIVIVPSKEVEGFSLIAAEAALLERPVVATNVGGLSETVLDGVTGFLVPPGDALEMSESVMRLLGDAHLRQGLGAAARRRALTKFGHERFIDEIAELYARVLGEQHLVTAQT